MTSNVIQYESDDADEFKRHIDQRPSQYVLAGPRELGPGRLMLHSARCSHVKKNMTARLIAPGQIRVVAPTARVLMDWLREIDMESYQTVNPCSTCHTAEVIERARR